MKQKSRIAAYFTCFGFIQFFRKYGNEEEVHVNTLILFLEMFNTGIFMNKLYSPISHFCLSQHLRSLLTFTHSKRTLPRAILKMSSSLNKADVTQPLPVVGVVQMTTGADKEANWQQGKTLVERACKLGAQMVFLPEAFDYIGSSRQESLALSETVNGTMLKRYRDLAKSLDVWLSLGGMHERPDDTSECKRLYNTHFIINSGGDICGKYSKAHLFDVDIPGGVRLLLFLNKILSY